VLPVFESYAEAHSASSGATSVDPAPFSVPEEAIAEEAKPADAPMARTAADSGTSFLGWKAKPFK
jgi:hypothetical protein